MTPRHSLDERLTLAVAKGRIMRPDLCSLRWANHVMASYNGLPRHEDWRVTKAAQNRFVQNLEAWVEKIIAITQK